jgi:hypothetical protein
MSREEKVKVGPGPAVTNTPAPLPMSVPTVKMALVEKPSSLEVMVRMALESKVREGMYMGVRGRSRMN